MFDAILEFAGAFPLTIIILAIMWKGDDMIGEGLRKDLSSYLSTISLPKSAPNWAAMTANYYDRLFGSRYLSFRFVTVSFAISLISFCLINLSLSIINHNLFDEASRIEFLREYQELLSEAKITLPKAIFYLLVSALLLNGLADYLSNIETRFLVKIWDEGRINSVLVLVADLVLSVIIFCSTFMIFGIILDTIELILGIDNFNWRFYPRFLWPIHAAIDLGKSDALIATAFFTTFSTSIWIWCIVFLSKTPLFKKRNAMGSFVHYALPVSEKPIRSVGIVSALIVLAFGLLL